MTVSSERLSAEIDELAKFSAHPSPAVSRVIFSSEDLAARAWLVEKCQDAGLETRFDAVGNLFARRVGSDPSLPAIATGSHIDAIPNAGRFDGVVGVLGGLEAIRSLHESGVRLRHSVELIMFTAEEPTRFGIGCLGSRLLSGALDPSAADAMADSEGSSLAVLRCKAGLEGPLDTVRLAEGFYSAFVELHIEQGPILEREELDIGVVEKIAAPAALRVRFVGEGGHAGAVLMPDRHDAALGAAETALAVERQVLESGSSDCVGTAGLWRILPGAINSVPCEAVVEIDIRDTQIRSRDGVLEGLRRDIEEIAARRGLRVTIETISADPPAACAPEVIEAIEDAVRCEGLAARRLVSRAYHDSLFLARIAPTSMIFIPCHRGYSHRPDEFSSPDQIARGVAVLAESIRSLDSL
ncbi:MAG: M20 family metallo-hydrolase [Terrimicrobiaceae bacterium]